MRRLYEQMVYKTAVGMRFLIIALIVLASGYFFASCGTDRIDRTIVEGGERPGNVAEDIGNEWQEAYTLSGMRTALSDSTRGIYIVKTSRGNRKIIK